jgi:TRAP-type C4-dicarboxylate transport system permease small subunit
MGAPSTGTFMTSVRGLVAGVRILTAVLLLISVLLNFTNVIGRYIFSAPISSAEEVMLFLLVAIVFLGNSVVAWERKQIRMDVFLHGLPVPVRRALDVAADLAAIAVSVTLIVLGWPAIAMLAEYDERSQVAEIPLAIPQALVPIGLGLTAVLIAARLIAGLTRRRDPFAGQDADASS